MSIEAMKMALEAMESAIKAGDWVVDGACDPDMALVALRQAIEQAEKQEPFIYVREDNEKLFGGYEHCSEADSGAFPVYTAPVDAVNMKQERVDETAKCKHEPWCDSVTKLLLSMPPQIPPCNCKTKQGNNNLNYPIIETNTLLDKVVETAIQGHASTRDAIRWAVQQEREACAKIVEADGLARGYEGLVLIKAAGRIRARGET